MKGNGLITLHPEFLINEGRKEFVILPYDEFIVLNGLLEDAEDIFLLRAAKQEEKDKPSISIADVKKELGIS